MMAQQIVTLCDQHLADGESVAGVTYSVTITGPDLSGKTYETDACPAHAGMLADLAGWLSEHGRPVSGSGSAASNPMPCPVCGKTSANRSALLSHVRGQHGTTLAALEGKPADHKCPECGATFTTPQGMGAHRFRTHGTAGASADSKAGQAARKAPASSRRNRGEA